MERIHAADAVGAVLFNGRRDPFGPVAGDDLNAAALLLGQALKEAIHNHFSMVGSCPNNGICVVIHDHGDVFVPLLVAGLINANPDKAVQAAASVWLDLLERTGYAAPYGRPVDAHVFGNGTLGKVYRQPAHCEVEVLCKAATGIGPGHIGHNAAVFRAFDALGIAFQMNGKRPKIKTSPLAAFSNRKSFLRAFPVANWTSALCMLRRPHIQIKVLHTELIFAQSAIFHLYPLDIEDLFA